MKITFRIIFISSAMIASTMAYAGDNLNQTSEERSATTTSAQSTADKGLKGSTGNRGETGVSGKRSWPGHAGAWKAAEQSPEALRQYIERTKSIHGLSFSDFAPGN